MSRRVLAGWVVLLASLALWPGESRAVEDARPVDPRELLHRAFTRRYECDTRQQMTLHLQSRGGRVQEQRLDVATKIVGGNLRAIARFTHPPDLRDTALLMIEQPDRPDDYFVFLPALAKVRRVSGAQRSDSFMGTDLSYEDLERRRATDFDQLTVHRESLAGEDVRIVRGIPVRASSYARVEFAIAQDHALLETRYFKNGSNDPVKVIRFPRAGLREEDGTSLPTRILVDNVAMGTKTDVVVTELEINPVLDDRLFTTNALMIETDIP